MSMSMISSATGTITASITANTNTNNNMDSEQTSSSSSSSSATMTESGYSSAGPDTSFDSMFPGYSHTMFSNLLEGDLLDEEINALWTSTMEPEETNTNTISTSTDAYQAQAVNPNIIIQGEHPGMLMARTAEALDFSVVQAAPAAEAQQVISKAKKNTKGTNKRSLTTLHSATKQNISARKARKISFRTSECGASALAVLAPNPNIAPASPEDNNCQGPAMMSDKSVSIVDALIQTLSTNNTKQEVNTKKNDAYSMTADPLREFRDDAKFGRSALSASSSKASMETICVAPKAEEPKAFSGMTTMNPLEIAPKMEVVPVVPSSNQGFLLPAPVAIAPTPLQVSSSETESNPSSGDTINTCASASVTKKTGGRKPISTQLEVIPDELRIPKRKLSPQERHALSRDRNRIHARNTRIRKKAYVDELKQALNEMVEERDADRALLEQQEKLLQQHRHVRFMVMQHFLKLIGVSSTDHQGTFLSRWQTLLKEDVSVSFPAVPAGADVMASGIDQVMEQAKTFAQSLLQQHGEVLTFECDRKSILMDGATVVVEVVMKVSPTVSVNGFLRTSFCEQTNKIQSSRLIMNLGAVVPRVS